MLREFQEDFRRALLRGEYGAAAARMIDDRVPGAERIKVYRGNTMVSLTEVLANAFPACVKVTTEENFKVAARAFIKAHPPARPYLFSYGDAFPDFLENFAPAKRDHPFLPDLARLEWARIEAYYAADAAPLDPAAIQEVPEDAYPSLRFTAHPATRLVETRYRVHDFWSGAVDPEANRHAEPVGAEYLLVTRPGAEIAVEQVDAAGFAFARALVDGTPLEQAAEAALSVDTAFDLMAALADHLTRGTFAGLRPDTGHREGKLT